MDHFIYFIQCMDSKKHIKIGVARNVQRRIDELQTGCPYELKLIAQMHLTSRTAAYSLESDLHRRLKRFNIRGEWFSKKVRLKKIPELIKYKESLKKQKEKDIYPNEVMDEIEIAFNANLYQ